MTRGRSLTCTRSHAIVTRLGSGRSARHSWHTTVCDSSSCISSPASGARLQLEQRAGSEWRLRAFRLSSVARSLAIRRNSFEFGRSLHVVATSVELASTEAQVDASLECCGSFCGEISRYDSHDAR